MHSNNETGTINPWKTSPRSPARRRSVCGRRGLGQHHAFDVKKVGADLVSFATNVLRSDRRGRTFHPPRGQVFPILDGGVQNNKRAGTRT
jgi:hypothetical protein